MTEAPKFVNGRELKIAFPPTIEGLREAGVEFLTRAFRASGVLGAGNSVTGITEFTEFYGGGMGRKLLLGVKYARDEAGLETKLFVKYPRDFGDPLRDLFGPLMEPEVVFALMSRNPGFPIDVPRCYFADYDPETVSGILVTARVAYGQGDIEPAHDKCLDYLLENPLPNYLALTDAMAKLAAYQKSGRLRDEIEQKFPFVAGKLDPGSRIPYTAETLAEKVAVLLEFARQAPQLLEEANRDPGFLEDFGAQAQAVLPMEQRIRDFLDGDGDYVAICHWNMNLDNAWFYRTEDGLQAGLLDWGSVAQMNLAQAFYGMTCAAESSFLNTHRGALLERFVAQYRAHGGPEIAFGVLEMMLKLAVAVLGIAWILDAPTIIGREIPDYAALTGRADPRIRDNFLARAQLQLLNVFLNEWREMRVSAAITAFAEGEGRA